MSRTHGGRWADYLEEHGEMPLDFSSNVSPLGMPKKAQEAACKALVHAERYPDPSCRKLREAICTAYGIPAEAILCGNGAAELIDRLALATLPRHALITAPTFGEYRASLERLGCALESYQLSAQNNFSIDEGILERITPLTDLLILCEPNNPTGRCSEQSLLECIATRCDQTNTLLVIDECFCEFLEKPWEHSFLHALEQHRLLVLCAFTKFYGMAGLRLGWCASSDEGLLARMADAGQPWPVSSIAQEAGRAALRDTAYPQRLRSLIAKERGYLAQGLEKLGFQLVPGEANYLLFFAHTANLAWRLEQEGILIRDCSDYEGLCAGWYRVAVRSREENRALLHALERSLS